MLGDYIAGKTAATSGSATQAPPALRATIAEDQRRPRRLEALSPALTSSTPTLLDTTSPTSSSLGTGPYSVRELARTAVVARVVDYSFMALAAISQLTHVHPRSGLVHRAPGHAKQSTATASPEPSATAAAPDSWEMYMQSTHAGRTEKTSDGIVILKAKDETYSFKEMQSMVLKGDDTLQRFTIDANGNLVERTLTDAEWELRFAGRQFDCTALKLDNNNLTLKSFESLERTLKIRFYRPVVSITTLDLSFNQLEGVPVELLGLTSLHTLLLHCNRIQSLNEVRKLQPLHATLRKLSLNENPLQEQLGRRMKYAVLLELPSIQCLDDVRVTPKDREKVALFGSLFAPMSIRKAYQARQGGAGAGGQRLSPMPR